MRMYKEDVVPINEVIENIYTLFGYELKECKKVELELRVNVKKDKYFLDDIWDKIRGQLNSEAMISSNCERWYTEKYIPDGMCEYRIKIFIKENINVGA